MVASRPPGHGSPTRPAGSVCWGGRSPWMEGNHGRRHRQNSSASRTPMEPG
uniref:Uncharacterized protein n=1 Tax=Triticum urartu TaxID=4572 RepID=A0A8R7V7X0_TRIUA